DFRHVEHAYLSKQLARLGPRQLQGHSGRAHSPVIKLVLSADGKRLFSGSSGLRSGEIKVWDAEAGKETLIVRHTAPVRGLAVSSEGKLLCFSSQDGTIRVWDVEAGKEILTLRGHTAGATSLALSADGKRLFYGKLDRTINVWDVDADKHLFALRG